MTKKYHQKCLLPVMGIVFLVNHAAAQNPIVRNQLTPDPSARVFGDRVYAYPSHDILVTESKGQVEWFCMEDYQLISSANLSDYGESTIYACFSLSHNFHNTKEDKSGGTELS